ncbi:MAG TPA: hypothetical protein VHW00_00950 [Thermoanaerobaculia bacterium]|nr:hypothetical protein [Thermoanaerobaculia bacterium]
MKRSLLNAAGTAPVADSDTASTILSAAVPVAPVPTLGAMALFALTAMVAALAVMRMR